MLFRRFGRAYTGCHGRGKPVISAPPRAVKLVPAIPPSSSRGADCPMDSFELNKVLGAVLATCLFTLALNIGASALFSAPKPEKPGYAIAAAAPAAGGKGGEAAAPAAAAEPIE